MRITLLFLWGKHQPKPLDHPPVFRAGGDDIDPRGVDGAVPQNVRQLRDILLHAVKCPGKELAQVVWKHLCFLDTGGLA